VDHLELLLNFQKQTLAHDADDFRSDPSTTSRPIATFLRADVAHASKISDLFGLQSRSLAFLAWLKLVQSRANLSVTFEIKISDNRDKVRRFGSSQIDRAKDGFIADLAGAAKFLRLYADAKRPFFTFGFCCRDLFPNGVKPNNIDVPQTEAARVETTVGNHSPFSLKADFLKQEYILPWLSSFESDRRNHFNAIGSCAKSVRQLHSDSQLRKVRCHKVDTPQRNHG
jgi:hypothetical protein